MRNEVFLWSERCATGHDIVIHLCIVKPLVFFFLVFCLGALGLKPIIEVIRQAVMFTFEKLHHNFIDAISAPPYQLLNVKYKIQHAKMVRQALRTVIFSDPPQHLFMLQMNTRIRIECLIHVIQPSRHGQPLIKTCNFQRLRSIDLKNVAIPALNQTQSTLSRRWNSSGRQL